MTADNGKNMVEFPPIVRQRMSLGAHPGEHPDPGILTAFVEGTISKLHRQDVLKHLAACSDCNRLMSLITPEQVNNQVQPGVAPRRWFSWTPMRWAAVSASAAVIVGAVWIGQVNRQQASHNTTAAVAPQATISAQVPPSANVVADARPSSEQPKRNALPTRELAKTAPPAVVPPSGVFDPALQAQSRPAVPGDVQGSAAFQTTFIAPPSSNQTSQPEPATPPATKPVAPATSATVPAVPAGPVSATWSVANGVLQHSTDGGSTWAAVAIPNAAGLRVVSSTSQHLWAGGDGGALYHSIDGGRSWSAVVPSADGHVLTANIIRMAFMNPMHGWIVDADGGYWATRDGGVTWAVQMAKR
jgi:hypothetical protein